jgi:Fe-S cluster biogenesis protein NfuA
MHKDEKNVVTYTEISGMPYIKNDSGYLELMDPSKAELYAKPPIIKTNFRKLKDIVYFNSYRRVRHECESCNRITMTLVEDKNKIYHVCDCGKIFFINNL